MKHYHVFLKMLLFLAVSSLTTPVWAVSFNQVFFFGDSLTDAGNNAVVFDNLFGGARTPTPISDSTFIPFAPYAGSNRYSNGPVWAEQFAASLGLSATPSLLPGGNDYAYGGARTGPPSITPPLVDQVNQFLVDFSNTAPPDALYVIAGGGNDARDALTSADPAAIVNSYITNVVTMVGQLTAAGATKIVLWNVPDIGATPAVRLAGASGVATPLVRQMNDGLNQALAASLPPAVVASLIRFDAFGLIQNIVNNPAGYDFTNVTDACAAINSCSSDLGEARVYLFWDGIHVTTAAHGVFARVMLLAVPEPATWMLLFLGITILVLPARARSATGRNS